MSGSMRARAHTPVRGEESFGGKLLERYDSLRSSIISSTEKAAPNFFEANDTEKGADVLPGYRGKSDHKTRYHPLKIVLLLGALLIIAMKFCQYSAKVTRRPTAKSGRKYGMTITEKAKRKMAEKRRQRKRQEREREAKFNKFLEEHEQRVAERKERMKRKNNKKKGNKNREVFDVMDYLKDHDVMDDLKLDEMMEDLKLYDEMDSGDDKTGSVPPPFDNMEDFMDDDAESVTPMIDDVQNSMDDKTESVTPAIDDVNDSMDDNTESAAPAIDDVKDSMDDKTESATPKIDDVKNSKDDDTESVTPKIDVKNSKDSKKRSRGKTQ